MKNSQFVTAIIKKTGGNAKCPARYYISFFAGGCDGEAETILADPKVHDFEVLKVCYEEKFKELRGEQSKPLPAFESKEWKEGVQIDKYVMGVVLIALPWWNELKPAREHGLKPRALAVNIPGLKNRFFV